MLSWAVAAAAKALEGNNLMCHDDVGGENEEAQFWKTGQWFGSYHTVKRRLRRYAADDRLHKHGFGASEGCTKHGYMSNDLLPGGQQSTRVLNGCLIVCIVCM